MILVSKVRVYVDISRVSSGMRQQTTVGCRRLSEMAISVTISVHAYIRYFEREHTFITYL